MDESVLSVWVKRSAQRGVAKNRVVAAYALSYGSYAAPTEMSHVDLVYMVLEYPKVV